jgi:hypothetical protein
MSTTKISLKKEYQEYETGRGVTLKVYSVPTQLIENITTPYDSEKPKRPFVMMKIKGGGEQKRPLKKGDEGWEEYQEEIEKWEEKCDDFRAAVSLVMAVKKSVEYPNPITSKVFDEDTQLLIEQGLFKLPTNEWELKAMWLRDKVLGGHDEIQMQWILRRFSGVPEEIIEQQKSRFWNILSGKTSLPVANGNSGEAGLEEVSEQEQPLLEIQ